MKNYYLLDNGKKRGPLSLETLKSFDIFSDTLIWEESFEDWKEAQYISELDALVIKNTPPIQEQKIPPPPRSLNLSDDREDILDDYDYSHIEDIAGVNYRNGMMVVGAYIILNVLAKSFAIHPLGIFIATGLAVGSWWYFKKYFDAMDDQDTGKFINWVMGAHIIYGVACLFAATTEWEVEFGVSIVDIILGAFGMGKFDYVSGLLFSIKIAAYGTLLAMATIFIAGIRIIWINNRHPFPLKRIAVSAMFLIPLGMLIQLGEGVSKAVGTGLIGNTILMLPFIFLLHHFYRAETEDVTP